MYVGVGDVRKSFFLYNFCMAKLFDFGRGLKKVTVPMFIHPYNVRGYGCCTKIFVPVLLLYTQGNKNARVYPSALC